MNEKQPDHGHGPKPHIRITNAKGMFAEKRASHNKIGANYNERTTRQESRQGRVRSKRK